MTGYMTSHILCKTDYGKKRILLNKFFETFQRIITGTIIHKNHLKIIFRYGSYHLLKRSSQNRQIALFIVYRYDYRNLFFHFLSMAFLIDLITYPCSVPVICGYSGRIIPLSDAYSEFTRSAPL